ncbi:YveK family protein [Pontibacillus salicampi]|uniref:YveK family protein n=1 Tax=Pontibacillus salicampi TaxID=1449801 RepID=A0ABV6LSZ3_9BACI
MKEQMDIKTFFRILKRRIVTILITTILFSIASGTAVFYLMKPTYEAREYILVGNLTNEEEVYVDPQTINRLIASTVDFITSPIVLDSVGSTMGLSQAELEEKITIVNKEDSQIVSVVIRDSDQQRSQELADHIASTSVSEIKNSLQMENISVLNKNENANQPEQVNNPIVNLLIGTMVGMFCGIGMAMLKDHWDDSLQRTEQIEKELGLQFFGEVEITKDNLPLYYRKQFNKENAKADKGGGIHAESH